MSKIYEALEKADKHLLIPPEIEVKGEKGSEDRILALPKAVGIASDQRLVSFFQPESLASEQFRKLRTYLLRSKTLEFPRTIMVTSATNGEGKTFVSANLAVGIANDLHAHALLVDSDLRNPNLTQWFRLRHGVKGLSNYLMGEGRISELLVRTKIEKLSLLPAGAIQDNPTELIGSKRMETLVDELKSRYQDRYVIFDSTPLLATTEPEVLAKLVDGIIIVVRAGVTPRETVKQAIATLEKEKILGLVLNDLKFKSSGLSSRYFGSDGYYYRYGYGKSKSKPDNRRGKPFRFTRQSDRDI